VGELVSSEHNYGGHSMVGPLCRVLVCSPKAAGWFAADISDKRNVLIREFDPNADILLIPKMQGG